MYSCKIEGGYVLVCMFILLIEFACSVAAAGSSCVGCSCQCGLLKVFVFVTMVHKQCSPWCYVKGATFSCSACCTFLGHSVIGSLVPASCLLVYTPGNGHSIMLPGSGFDLTAVFLRMVKDLSSIV